MATSVNNLLARLLEIKSTAAEVVPEGWKTTQAWADVWGKSRGLASSLIKSGVDAGVMEGRLFRIAAGMAGVRPVPHYREKKQ